MAAFQNAMEVFKLLEKSNCRKCNEATCLVFAANVFKGTRQISECPRLDPETAERYRDRTPREKDREQAADEAIAHLRREIEAIDLTEAAARTGGVCRNGKLTLKIMGKDLSVDSRGNFYTDLHIHAWLAVPVLKYILAGKGRPVSGDWVPLRELDGGKDWFRLFGQRCEIPLKNVADRYTDLFEDMVHLFNGRKAGSHFDSDISVVLHPLPLVPMLICYWKPDEGLESDLHLFFDNTAEANLPIEELFTLGVGLVVMFEKIAQRHGL